MRPVEITYFAVALFLALVALIKWKHRRDTIAERLKRGLRGYIAGEGATGFPASQETPGEDLIPV